jgi:hypothetical protein
MPDSARSVTSSRMFRGNHMEALTKAWESLGLSQSTVSGKSATGSRRKDAGGIRDHPRLNGWLRRFEYKPTGAQIKCRQLSLNQPTKQHFVRVS